MRKLLLLFALLFFTGPLVFAQPSQYTSAADSDAEAVALVKGVRAKYDGYKTIQANFTLDISLPGRPVETQQGTITRQGDQARFKLGTQEGIITDQAAYMIQHDNKEVMISNLPDEEEQTGLLTPQTLFNFYEGDDYVLSVRGEDVVDGRKAKIIELKPVDRNNSEFTKLRLLVDVAKKELIHVSAFTPDGANFTFSLNKTRGNIALPAGTFAFDKSAFPGYHVEDLRY
ncbi:MAG: outer membrane lipoprotein carrier protein LolA [Bacteroidota bacterium]